MVAPNNTALLRPDPRLKKRPNVSEKYFKLFPGKPTPGRFAIALMIFKTRTEALGNISLKIFADLCIEDRKRALILEGANPQEVDRLASLSPATVMRLEEGVGVRGASPETLALVAPRIPNPLSGLAFTPLEFQGVQQGFLEIPLKEIESQSFIDLAVQVNRARDFELRYRT